MDTLSESHIMVRFGVFRKRSVFFFFFSFELPGDAELHSYFCGCEVHSMHDAAYLWPLSISFIDCIHNTCCLIWGVCELPHLPCFCCTCHLYKMMTCMTLIYSHPWSDILNRQLGLCAPCARLFVFLCVLFHKGHELVWSTLMAERALCSGWRAIDLRPCFLSCSWVELWAQHTFLLPARWSAGRHRISSDEKYYSIKTVVDNAQSVSVILRTVYYCVRF